MKIRRASNCERRRVRRKNNHAMSNTARKTVTYKIKKCVRESFMGGLFSRLRGRRRHDFLLRLGRIVPENGQPAPGKAGLVRRLEADLLRGQHGLLVEVLALRGALVAAALIDEHMLDRAGGVDRDAQHGGA